MINYQKNLKLLIRTSAGTRPLTDLEKCLLLILKTENNISSKRILILAKKFKICAACSDRSEIFFIGEKLSKKNLVKKELKKGEYFWSFTKKGEQYKKIV
ncbi:hypothetical protein KKE99_04635 [Patescibacteria group bacterium]|nr:hypothetical protein [Patescibacteria group bacterium]